MDSLSVGIAPLSNSAEEVEEMDNLLRAAFGSDPLVQFTSNQSEAQTKAKQESVAKHMKNLADSRLVYFKAVDATNPNRQMLGVAIWIRVDDPQQAIGNIAWGETPPSERTACDEATIGALRRWRHNYFRERNQPFLYMAILAVAPEARRRGVGGALLEAGLKEADRRQRPTFVASSPDGLKLYKKYGWEEKMKLVVNLANYGGDDVEWSSVALVRPPGASR